MKKQFLIPSADEDQAVEQFQVIYRKTLQELKGIYSKNELYLIIDSFNSLAFTDELLGDHIIAEVKDACSLEDADKKWDVNKEKLIEKLNRLCTAQLACLELWAKGYWESVSTQEDRDKYLEEFV